MLPDLSALALRPLVTEFARKAQELAQKHAGALAAAGLTAAGAEVVEFLVGRFGDPSRKPPAALRRAADRAWRSLEVALAGESWWSWLTGRGEEKAFRQEIRAFLDANPLQLPPGRDEAFRRAALQQLRTARKQDLIPGGDADPHALAAEAADLARFADPLDLRDAEWRAVSRTAHRMRRAGHSSLADLLELRPSAKETPLLAVAVRFFFRREVESDPQLFQGLVYEQVDQLGTDLRAGFEGVSRAIEQHGELLAEVLAHAEAIRADVLDLRAEQSRQGEGQQAIYAEVLRLGEKLDRLHERNLRPADSLSIRGEGERTLVRQLVGRYRALPEEQRQQLPALLDAIGRLELAAGDFESAAGDFRQVAAIVTEPSARAAAHHGAYLAALERRDWGAALAELREASKLDAARFAPFPLDRYEPERILGAGGFGVVFLCRNRFSRGRLVIKALRTDELERDLSSVFEEAAALEELDHPAIIRLRDCGFADAAQTRPFLVMEYCDGPTLEQHVRDAGPVPAPAARGMAKQMAEALAAAHARGILHRDVKPGNVLVRGDGAGLRVKLIDFGLALRRRTVSETIGHADALAHTILGGSIAGTIDYAAPEQMGKLPGVSVGPAADVYGFGRTLCYALFKTPQPVPRHWKGLQDEALGDLLAGCVEEDPKDRPANFDEVLDRLGHSPRPVEDEELKADLAECERLIRSLQGSKGYIEKAAPRRLAAWRAAAERGSAGAQWLLAKCLEKGLAVGQDLAQAAAWYRKAADQGNANARNDLGALYANGWGVPKDGGEAARWFRAAAEQGHALSQYSLGWLYETGFGVPQDDAAAARWYRMAADRGHADAREALRRIGAG